MLQQIARFFIGDAELEAVASEAELFAAIEAQRTEPQFGDTVILHGDFEDYVAEFISEYRPTGRTTLYLYDPILRGGIWHEQIVDSNRVTLASKGTAIHVWTRYPHLWFDEQA